MLRTGNRAALCGVGWLAGMGACFVAVSQAASVQGGAVVQVQVLARDHTPAQEHTAALEQVLLQGYAMVRNQNGALEQPAVQGQPMAQAKAQNQNEAPVKGPLHAQALAQVEVPVPGQSLANSQLQNQVQTQNQDQAQAQKQAQTQAASQDQAGSASDALPSDPQAVALMQQMVTALGGPKWLAIHDVEETGRTSGFYHGTPTGAIGDFHLLRTVPVSRTDLGLQRVEFTKKRNVVNILTADQDWEMTYRGKRLLPPEEYGTVFLRRAHTLDVAVRVWWHEPGTVLLFGGHKVAERHLIDEITLLDAQNDNITLQLDADSHLPVRVSFTWRDPLYKDKNEEATEYADFHPVDGLPTPLNETTYHNGDMTSQRYLQKVSYNVPIPPDAFDVDATALKLAK
jgi:hypothetical protein